MGQLKKGGLATDPPSPILPRGKRYCAREKPKEPCHGRQGGSGGGSQLFVKPTKNNLEWGKKGVLDQSFGGVVGKTVFTKLRRGGKRGEDASRGKEKKHSVRVRDSGDGEKEKKKPR